jgi:hypothetical protein
MIQRSETKELTARLKEPRKFIRKYKPLQAFVVENEGMPLADFLQTDLRLLFR